MTKPYLVEKKENKFYIKEVASDHYLNQFNDRDSANKHCKMLNRGNIGFQGWTPRFVADVLKPKT
jgi:hypothetical protein